MLTMRIRPSSALLALVCAGALLGCEGSPAPAAPPAPVEGPSARPADPAGVSSGEPAPATLPVWFSPKAFEHEKILRLDERSNELPNGQASTMLMLELKPGTSAEQCMQAVRAKLGESLSDLPEHTPTPQGYLNLVGKSDGFQYSVVCGIAKGTPTLFMSVIQ